MTRLDGHDGSHYQFDAGPVDFNLLRSACWWLAWKATQGTTYIDPTFTTARAGADAVGFTHKLAYHWLSPNTDPAAQAEHFLATVGSFGLWGAMLDAEEGGITAGDCLAWCETVEDHLRRPCAIYSGLYVAGGTVWKSPTLRRSQYGPRAFHLAAYVTEAKLKALMVQTGAFPLFPFHAWQFSSNGPMPGIVGRADMNRIDDRAAYDRVCGITSQPSVPEEPAMTARPMRDDRPDGQWQGWAYDVDWQGHEWADAVNALGLHWEVFSAGVNVPTVPFSSLDAIRMQQDRPTPPPTVAGPVTEHYHVPGGVAP